MRDSETKQAINDFINFHGKEHGMGASGKKKNKSSDVDAIVSALKSHAMGAIDDVDESYGDEDDEELTSLLSDVISKAQEKQPMSTILDDTDDEDVNDFSDEEIDEYVVNDGEEDTEIAKETYDDEIVKETYDDEIDEEAVEETTKEAVEEDDLAVFAKEEETEDERFDEEEPRGDEDEGDANAEFFGDDNEEPELIHSDYDDETSEILPDENFEDIVEYRDIPAKISDEQSFYQFDNTGIYTISDEDDDDYYSGDDVTAADDSIAADKSETNCNIGELYMGPINDEYLESDNNTSKSDHVISSEEQSSSVERKIDINDAPAFAKKTTPVRLTSSEYGDYLQNSLPLIRSHVDSKTTPRVDDISENKPLHDTLNVPKTPSNQTDDDVLILDDDLADDISVNKDENKTDELVLAREKDENKKLADKNRDAKLTSDEYTSVDQNKKIRRKYNSEINAIIIRLAICAATTAFLLIYDVWQSTNTSEIFAGIFPIIEIFALIIIVVAVFKQLFDGCMGIFDLLPNIYSIPAFSVVMVLIYNALLSLVSIIKNGAFESDRMVLFGFSAGLCVVSALLAELLSKRQEANAFDLMTSDGVLYTAVADDITDLATNSDKRKKSYASGATHKNTYRVKRVGRVGKFMERSHKKIASHNGMIYVMGILPIIAFIIGCVSGFINGRIEVAVSSIGLTVFLGLPISAVLFVSIPSYIASKRMQKAKCAIVGEISIYECANTQTLVFDDIDAIELTTGIEMKPGSDSNIAKSTVIAKKVFTSLHMPLSQNFADDNGGSDDIVIKSIEANGIELILDHSANILIGDSSYFAARDIMVKASNKALAKYKDHTILYMAVNRVPKLAYLVGCRVKESIFEAATKLSGVGVKTVINSYDPGINDLYMSGKRPQNAAHIEIVKPGKFEKYAAQDAPDGVSISLNNPANIAYTVVMSHKIIKSRKVFMVLNYLSAVIGVLLSALVGMVPVLYNLVAASAGIRICIVLAFQIITVLPCVLISLFDLKNG